MFSKRFLLKSSNTFQVANSACLSCFHSPSVHAPCLTNARMTPKGLNKNFQEFSVMATIKPDPSLKSFMPPSAPCKIRSPQLVFFKPLVLCRQNCLASKAGKSGITNETQAFSRKRSYRLFLSRIRLFHLLALCFETNLISTVT